jgi:hypothetical protein
MFDDDFLLTVTELEIEGLIAFKIVVTKSLGNNKDPYCVTVVAKLLEKFSLGVFNGLNKSFFMDSPPANLGAVSEEHEGRFHQGSKEMERTYRGRWNVNMMVAAGGRYSARC